MNQKQIYAYGIVINPTPYKGGTIFAELTPSGSTGGRLFWRRLLPNVGNWWFEVISQDGHHYEFEGGQPFCATCGQYNDGDTTPEKCYCDNFNDAIDQTKATIAKIRGEL